MGVIDFFSRRKPEPANIEDRAPQTGVKYKDMLVLDQLLQAGANLRAPRHVMYYLYFNDRAKAEAAAGEATRSQFTATVSEQTAEQPESWQVVCERKSYVLSMDIVRDNTDYFEQLAARFGGDYDGWVASVH